MPTKITARNRKAFHDYDILEKVVAGIELQGTEVKSVRAGRVNLLDSYATYSEGELYIQHMHISPFEQGSIYNHDPYRKRKLLLHRRQIEHLGGEVTRKHLTIVPLTIFFERQWVKVELGLCRGRKKYDKRQKIAAEESKRRLDALVKSRRR
jgi:SsrA-binding protein